MKKMKMYITNRRYRLVEVDDNLAPIITSLNRDLFNESKRWIKIYKLKRSEANKNNQLNTEDILNQLEEERIDKEVNKITIRALKRLDELEKKIYIKLYRFGLQESEIANELNISEEEVKRIKILIDRKITRCIRRQVVEEYKNNGMDLDVYSALVCG